MIRFRLKYILSKFYLTGSPNNVADEFNSYVFQPRQKPIPGRLQGLPEDYGASGSTSQSDSDSEESKKEALSRKRKRAGHDADGNVTWTDESVRFLFEAYDAIHQRLWEESKGQVKYQKKWTPILKAMQARFGNHFTKKQCQSKYWSVRRECSEYRYLRIREHCYTISA